MEAATIFSLRSSLLTLPYRCATNESVPTDLLQNLHEGNPAMPCVLLYLAAVAQRSAGESSLVLCVAVVLSFFKKNLLQYCLF